MTITDAETGKEVIDTLGTATGFYRSTVLSTVSPMLMTVISSSSAFFNSNPVNLKSSFFALSVTFQFQTGDMSKCQHKEQEEYPSLS